MVYKFRLLSDEVDNFRRDIEIDSDATSFFICNERWVKEIEITLEDMGGMSEDESYVMADTVIGDIIEEEKQKLAYVFDPLGDRMFYMELSKIEFGKDIDKAVCTKSVGDAPAQMLNFDELMNKAPIVEASDDFNEDFYGSDSYNEDDLDPEGYGIGDIADMSSIDDLY